jgi:tRNA 2-thiocytidine biosynthesis protein TtcA
MIRNRTEKAILDFGMIQPGDRILLGISGGADSLSLLQMFVEGFPHVTRDYSFIACHADMGFSKKSQDIEAHFKDLKVAYRILSTKIADHALDLKAKKNPCFICSMYRRKEIYRIAGAENCNKIAYAHHKDDIVETLLINILYGRKIETMNPVQPVFKGNMHIIRPFTYIDEQLLKQFAECMNLPIVTKLCPMDGFTRRQKIKKWIASLQQEEKNANIKENIFKSFYHVHMQFPVKKP